MSIAEFAVFAKKILILNVIKIGKGSQNLRSGLKLISLESSLWIWYQLCRNFPASWSSLGDVVKSIFSETRFFFWRVGVFPPET
jgi:hypothetical protein